MPPAKATGQRLVVRFLLPHAGGGGAAAGLAGVAGNATIFKE